MLVLTRNLGQRIVVGRDVEIAVLQIRGNRVRLGISAPPEIAINRSEVWERNGNGGHAVEACEAQQPILPQPEPQ